MITIFREPTGMNIDDKYFFKARKQKDVSGKYVKKWRSMSLLNTNNVRSGMGKIKRLTLIGKYGDGDSKLPHRKSLIHSQRIVCLLFRC